MPGNVGPSVLGEFPVQVVIELMDRVFAVDTSRAVCAASPGCYAVTHSTTSLQSAGTGALATRPRVSP